MMRDRWFLLKRQLHITIRLRDEHGWSWPVAWQMSRVHQRHMLLILAAMRQDEAIVEAFRIELEHDLDTLTLEGAV